MIKTMFLFGLLFLLSACNNTKQKPGAPARSMLNSLYEEPFEGFYADSTQVTQPGSVLLTGMSNYRITPIFKLNYRERGETYFTGSNRFLFNYSSEGNNKSNNWHNNFLPGLEAVQGYNMLNLSLYRDAGGDFRDLFPTKVLVNTVYFPARSQDTLNGQLVERNYYLVSAYDEDSNGDGLVDRQDLRRFYYFSREGERLKTLVPENYSVQRSEYDSDNDRMLVYARQDKNNDGALLATEPIHIFWINLKNPAETARIY